MAPALAGAQELGAKGDVVFSVDRLMGITGTHVVGEFGPADYKNDWTSFSFGWRASPDNSPFDVPRFAFDYLVIDHLSIGGSLGYASLDVDQGNDYATFIIAPRVGYAYAFGRVVGIWPRAGFTYHSTSSDNQWDEKGFALSLECPFTFSPHLISRSTSGRRSISICSAPATRFRSTSAIAPTARLVSTPAFWAGSSAT